MLHSRLTLDGIWLLVRKRLPALTNRSWDQVPAPSSLEPGASKNKYCFYWYAQNDAYSLEISLNKEKQSLDVSGNYYSGNAASQKWTPQTIGLMIQSPALEVRDIQTYISPEAPEDLCASFLYDWINCMGKASLPPCLIPKKIPRYQPSFYQPIKRGADTETELESTPCRITSTPLDSVDLERLRDLLMEPMPVMPVPSPVNVEHVPTVTGVRPGHATVIAAAVSTASTTAIRGRASNIAILDDQAFLPPVAKPIFPNYRDKFEPNDDRWGLSPVHQHMSRWYRMGQAAQNLMRAGRQAGRSVQNYASTMRGLERGLMRQLERELDIEDSEDYWLGEEE